MQVISNKFTATIFSLAVCLTLFSGIRHTSAQTIPAQSRVLFPNSTQTWEFVADTSDNHYYTVGLKAAKPAVKLYRSPSDTGEVTELIIQLLDVSTNTVLGTYNSRTHPDVYNINGVHVAGEVARTKAWAPGKTLDIDNDYFKVDGYSTSLIPRSLLDTPKKLKVTVNTASRTSTFDSEQFKIVVKKFDTQPNTPSLAAEYISGSVVKLNIDLGECKKLCPMFARVNRDGVLLKDIVLINVSEFDHQVERYDLHAEYSDKDVQPGKTYNYEVAFISQDHLSLGASAKATVIVPDIFSTEPMITPIDNIFTLGNTVSNFNFSHPSHNPNKIEYQIFKSGLEQSADHIELWVKPANASAMRVLYIGGTDVASYLTPGLHILEWNFADPTDVRTSQISYEIRIYSRDGSVLKSIQNKKAFIQYDQYIYSMFNYPNQKTTIVSPTNSKPKIGDTIQLKFTAASKYAYIKNSTTGEMGVVEVNFDPATMQSASFVLKDRICSVSDRSVSIYSLKSYSPLVYNQTSVSKSAGCTAWMNILPGKYEVYGKVESNWYKGTSDTITVQPGQSTSSGDTQSPTAPSNLKGQAVSSSQVNLTWTASTDNVGVQWYRIFRDGAQVSITNATNYSDLNLKAQTAYVYSVRAYDAVGNASQSSNPISVTTLAVTSGPTTPNNPPTTNPGSSAPVISSPMTVNCIQNVYCSVGLNGSGFTSADNIYWVGTGSNYTNSGKSSSYGGAYIRSDILVDKAPGTYDLYISNTNGSSNHISMVVSSASVLPTVTAVSPSSGPKGTTVTLTGKNFSTTGDNNWILTDGKYQIYGTARSTDGTHLTIKLDYSYTIPAGTVLKIFVDNDQYGFSDDDPDYKNSPKLFLITSGAGASASGNSSLTAGIFEAINRFYATRSK